MDSNLPLISNFDGSILELCYFCVLREHLNALVGNGIKLQRIPPFFRESQEKGPDVINGTVPR